VALLTACLDGGSCSGVGAGVGGLAPDWVPGVATALEDAFD